MKKELQTQKNKVGALLCIVLAVSLGTLTGCSDTKNDTSAVGDVSGGTAVGDGSEIIDSVIIENTEVENSADSQASENVRTLTIMKGGEPEEKQAELVSGEGFSLYLPREEWQTDGTNQWCATINQNVRIRVESYDSDQARQEALGGYTSGEGELVKQEGELLYKVYLHETENNVWCVFYCYPLEAEEGWGRELPVIVDTFAVTTP
ncbi:MAG: hypothetical protein K2N95_04830 [Lachnospiraceae bacterium]|nr:hypothetical protein [Lachnospiraceae bacterium]